MRCLICNAESPLAVMRVPFKCDCKLDYAILSRSVFEGNVYPDDLIEFYQKFRPDVEITKTPSDGTVSEEIQ